MRGFLSRLFLLLLFFFSSALFADTGYIGGGLGFMTDLGNLGKTITVDGLSSQTAYEPNAETAVMMGGCDSAPDPTACRTYIGGDSQQSIVPENKLITMERITGGLVHSETSGAMTGLVGSLFYEHNWDNNLFVRGGVSYTRKVLGGQSRSYIAGIKWYDITWDYRALYTPAYFGIKAGDPQTAMVYGGVGVVYFDGWFQVGGYNNGEIPLYILGQTAGTTTSINPITGKAEGGPIYHESTKFKTHGWGFTALLGLEKKFEGGDALFVEVVHVFAGGQGRGNTADFGGSNHMTTHPTYPVTLNGTFFSTGYKVGIEY